MYNWGGGGGFCLIGLVLPLENLPFYGTHVSAVNAIRPVAGSTRKLKLYARAIELQYKPGETKLVQKTGAGGWLLAFCFSWNEAPLKKLL